MAQTATSSTSGREAALARRRAMSSTGKAGLQGSAAPAANTATHTAAPPARVSSGSRAAASASAGRAASLARRTAMSTRGKAALPAGDRVRGASPLQSRPAAQAEAAPPAESGGCSCGCRGERAERAEAREAETSVAPTMKTGRALARRPMNLARTTSTGRAASLARRQATAARGKAGLSGNGMSAAQTARATNPHLSGRELAQAVRAQRSRQGSAGQKKSEPSGRMRPGKAAAPGSAQDAAWKVGASETGQGQTVTGTMVGRSRRVTGDEPSTCRTVTGTEYLGADIFREFCQAEPGKGPRKVGLSPTGRGNRVTGNEVGRSTRVTGDEPGTCKSVTGTEYVGADQTQAFCGVPAEVGPAKVTQSETRKHKPLTGTNVGRSPRVTGDELGSERELTGSQYVPLGEGRGQAPAKVGISHTLRGGSVSGTPVGRSKRVTGDEPGSCRNITGDDYVGQEQYRGFCENTPEPQDAKVGVSQTLKGETVTGTLTGRSSRVTGDEPGTCKAITGTPYAGAEQYRAYCSGEESTLAAARTPRQRSTPGAVMTGLQPGIGGKMTGDRRGACEPVSGTPSIGADQFAAACPVQPGSPDFPQPLGDTPWGQFSVAAPSHAAQIEVHPGAVTGTRYEQGQITGPFGMATGKVTGTEEFRFGQGPATQPAPRPALPEGTVEGRVKSRITGEGVDAGPKITGDDWERGDR
ncbi:MAG: CsoS2 family carboxysome shell protein, partial [Gammaproteobacteria bacterium]